MFYAPSTTDAWASVAYIQDQAALGWLVRGIHFHAASAIVIACGLHLLVTVLRGGYRRPRELVWWLGIILYALVLGWAVTGYVLRWDEAGYWANRVEIGIAAGTPVLGDQIRTMALGGNDYGNLTLTRFYALHALVLPVIAGLAVVAHVVVARRLGPVARAGARAVSSPRWPAQSVRNAVAMTVALVLLLGYVVAQHGADLARASRPVGRVMTPDRSGTSAGCSSYASSRDRGRSSRRSRLRRWSAASSSRCRSSIRRVRAGRGAAGRRRAGAGVRADRLVAGG